MRFPTMWYVRPPKPQISLRICAVWAEPLLVAWIFYECTATDGTSFWVSKLKRRLHKLVRVYSCQNATLLEITCCGSYISYLLRNFYGLDNSRGSHIKQTQHSRHWGIANADQQFTGLPLFILLNTSQACVFILQNFSKTPGCHSIFTLNIYNL